MFRLQSPFLFQLNFLGGQPSFVPTHPLEYVNATRTCAHACSILWTLWQVPSVTADIVLRHSRGIHKRVGMSFSIRFGYL